MKNALESLSKRELLNVIKMFSKNWLTVDGLWFSLVEEKYGLEEALDFDLKMWHSMASIQAKRVKEHFGLEGGGIKGVLKAMQFMTYYPSMPHEYSMDGPNQAYIWVTSCRAQEGRIRSGKMEFPCKPMGQACYDIFAKTIDPNVEVKCVFCPPDSHPSGVWCKWMFYSNEK